MSIFIAGHNGMVGSSILRKIKENNPHQEIILKNKHELDLLNQKDVINFYNEHSPTEVIIAAAKVGGIYANDTYPADFIYQNLLIQCNLIHGAFLSGVKRLLFLGSSCIYPKNIKNPIKEEYLLSGKLEETNEPYAIAKIAGIKLCESYNRQHYLDYISVMPCNLYGPGDNYDLKNSHVIPALIRKFYEAKSKNIPSVTIWGSGSPLREFM
ncbi:MAG: NAD-dependent epimerase/dehydratase family protein, partial [Flavobacteriaceae bacterium]